MLQLRVAGKTTLFQEAQQCGIYDTWFWAN